MAAVRPPIIAGSLDDRLRVVAEIVAVKPEHKRTLALGIGSHIGSIIHQAGGRAAACDKASVVLGLGRIKPGMPPLQIGQGMADTSQGQGKGKGVIRL